MKFRVEQSPYITNWDELLPKTYQFAFAKYKSKEFNRSWKEVGLSVFFLAPYGKIIKKAYTAWLDFEIAHCEGKVIEGGIKSKRKKWNEISKIKTLANYNRCFKKKT